MIITLCGSTRFKDTFMEVNELLTRAMHIVIMPGVWGHSGDSVTEEEKRQLDLLHKKKIDMSDAIFVINKDGYIGESTKSEIEYAKLFNKKIMYLEDNE